MFIRVCIFTVAFFWVTVIYILYNTFQDINHLRVKEEYNLSINFPLRFLLAGFIPFYNIFCVLKFYIESRAFIKVCEIMEERLEKGENNDAREDS